MCAKTGTAQNPHGKEHAMFVAFAPRENPQIARAVVVENGGYGSTSAAPIASLMIEQYLHDSISTPRLAEVERLAKMDLMPAAIKKWYYRRDSIRQSKIQIDENTPVENAVEDRKNTFDPEAEPGRKETPLPEQKNKMPIIAPDQRKNKKPNITT
jgi:penicillin-binding protein 2